MEIPDKAPFPRPITYKFTMQGSGAQTCRLSTFRTGDWSTVYSPDFARMMTIRKDHLSFLVGDRAGQRMRNNSDS